MKRITVLAWKWLSPYRKEGRSNALKVTAWFLIVLSVAVLLTGVAVFVHDPKSSFRLVLSASVAGAGSGLFGTAATVAALEMLREARVRASEHVQTVARLRSTDLGTVSKEIERLRVEGKLQSGYLDGVDLTGSLLAGLNLSYLRAVGATFHGVDFRDTNLYASDLRGANLSDITVSTKTNFISTKTKYAVIAGHSEKTLRTAGVG